jgi:hypothetical protein
MIPARAQHRTYTSTNRHRGLGLRRLGDITQPHRLSVFFHLSIKRRHLILTRFPLDQPSQSRDLMRKQFTQEQTGWKRDFRQVFQLLRHLFVKHIVQMLLLILPVNFACLDHNGRRRWRSPSLWRSSFLFPFGNTETRKALPNHPHLLLVWTVEFDGNREFVRIPRSRDGPVDLNVPMPVHEGRQLRGQFAFDVTDFFATNVVYANSIAIVGILGFSTELDKLARMRHAAVVTNADNLAVYMRGGIKLTETVCFFLLLSWRDHCGSRRGFICS